VEEADPTQLVFRRALERLSRSADEQIRDKPPGVCLTCDLVNDYDDTSFTTTAMSLPDDLKGMWVELGKSLEALDGDDLECDNDDAVRRPAWQAVRAAASRTLLRLRELR
jgi:hypothetical protein